MTRTGAAAAAAGVFATAMLAAVYLAGACPTTGSQRGHTVLAQGCINGDCCGKLGCWVTCPCW